MELVIIRMGGDNMFDGYVTMSDIAKKQEFHEKFVWNVGTLFVANTN